MATDEELVVAAVAGDEAAFEALVRRYEVKIRRLAYGFLRDAAAAEDVAQDTFVQAFRRLSSLTSPKAFSSWLYRIAVNQSHDELRRRSRVSVAQDDELESSLERQRSTSSQESAAHSRLDRRLLQRALAGLPEKYRTPLLLKDVEGMTYAEIAESLDWPMGTVQIRVHRGRLRLRRHLAEIGLPTPEEET